MDTILKTHKLGVCVRIPPTVGHSLGTGTLLANRLPPSVPLAKHGNDHHPPSVSPPSPRRRKPRVPTHDLNVHTASARVRSIRIRCESCTEAVSAVGQGGWTAHRTRVPTPSHQTSGTTLATHNLSVATVSALGFSIRHHHPSPTVLRISRRPPLRPSLQTCAPSLQRPDSASPFDPFRTSARNLWRGVKVAGVPSVP